MRIVGHHCGSGRNLAGVGHGRCKGNALQRHLVDRCYLVGLEFVPLHCGGRCVRPPVVRVEADAGRLDVTVWLVCGVALENLQRWRSFWGVCVSSCAFWDCFFFGFEKEMGDLLSEIIKRMCWGTKERAWHVCVLVVSVGDRDHPLVIELVEIEWLLLMLL